MKKITVLLLALSLALTLCACSSLDKIPSLEEIVENGAEWSSEQLQQAQGCTLADLENRKLSFKGSWESANELD